MLRDDNAEEVRSCLLAPLFHFSTFPLFHFCTFALLHFSIFAMKLKRDHGFDHLKVIEQLLSNKMTRIVVVFADRTQVRIGKC